MKATPLPIVFGLLCALAGVGVNLATDSVWLGAALTMALLHAGKGRVL